MNLHGLIDDATGGLGGEELCFTGFARRMLCAVILEVSRSIGQQARGIELSRHVRELRLNQLVPGQRFSELFACLCVKQTFIERAPGHPASSGPDTCPKHVERLQRQSQTIALLANHVFRRHTTVFEFEFTNWMWREHFCSFDNAEFRHARADDDCREFGSPIFASSRARKDSVEISDTCVRDKSLPTVDNKRVVFAMGGSLNRGNIRTRLRFSQSKRRDRLSLSSACQPEVSNMFGGGETDGVGAKSLHHEREVCQGRRVGKRFAS